MSKFYIALLSSVSAVTIASTSMVVEASMLDEVGGYSVFRPAYQNLINNLFDEIGGCSVFRPVDQNSANPFCVIPEPTFQPHTPTIREVYQSNCENVMDRHNAKSASEALYAATTQIYSTDEARDGVGSFIDDLNRENPAHAPLFRRRAQHTEFVNAIIALNFRGYGGRIADNREYFTSSSQGTIRLGDLFARVWGRIQTYSGANPAETTKDIESMKIALVNNLAQCVKDDGDIVCRRGYVERILLPIQGYYSDIVLEDTHEGAKTPVNTFFTSILEEERTRLQRSDKTSPEYQVYMVMTTSEENVDQEELANWARDFRARVRERAGQMYGNPSTELREVETQLNQYFDLTFDLNVEDEPAGTTAYSTDTSAPSGNDNSSTSIPSTSVIENEISVSADINSGNDDGGDDQEDHYNFSDSVLTIIRDRLSRSPSSSQDNISITQADTLPTTVAPMNSPIQIQTSPVVEEPQQTLGKKQQRKLERQRKKHLRKEQRELKKLERKQLRDERRLERQKNKQLRKEQRELKKLERKQLRDERRLERQKKKQLRKEQRELKKLVRKLLREECRLERPRKNNSATAHTLPRVTAWFS